MPHRCEAFLNGGHVARFHRQKVPVAPETARPRLNAFVAHPALDGVIIVDHLQRTKAKFTDMNRRWRVGPFAFLTLQRFNFRFSHKKTPRRIPWGAKISSY